jgi:hypothetical protein
LVREIRRRLALANALLEQRHDARYHGAIKAARQPVPAPLRGRTKCMKDEMSCLVARGGQAMAVREAMRAEAPGAVLDDPVDRPRPGSSTETTGALREFLAQMAMRARVRYPSASRLSLMLDRSSWDARGAAGMA